MSDFAPRYCEDCKFFTSAANPEVSECRYPRKIGVIGMVVRNPGIIVKSRFCLAERGNETDDSCGAAAKWFEPKV